ncbi:uncharacterized protein LOC104265758 [Ciona intestinalis]
MYLQMDRCQWDSIADLCRITCGLCGANAAIIWSTWSPWSSCSFACIGGKRMRSRHCLSFHCDKTENELDDCGVGPCPIISSEADEMSFSTEANSFHLANDEEQDRPRLQIQSRTYTGSGFGNEKDNKEFKCPANMAVCGEKSNQCVKDVEVCNGYYDCGNRFDEDDCLLGLRRDGKRAIMNWETHLCMDVYTKENGDIVPRMYKRCPGQKSPEVDHFFWHWQPYNLLVHTQTGKCLEAEIEEENITLLFKPCDRYNKHQLWICEYHSYRVQLKFGYTILPEGRKQDIYLTMEESNEANSTMILSSIRDPKRNDFHILETDRLNICSQRGVGGIWPIVPAYCSKTCGIGKIKVLRPCAMYYSFGLGITYKTRKTYLEAKSFCNANNWTLAADKNEQTHRFILNLQRDVSRAYIEKVVSPK